MIRTSQLGGDTWHQSIDDARHQLAFEFDSVGPWRSIPDDLEDASAYAIDQATRR